MKFTTLFTALVLSVFAGLPDGFDEREVAFFKSKIKIVPDFPKKGIMFRDVLPVLRDACAVKFLVDSMEYHLQFLSNRINVIVGVGDRGLLLGPTIAYKLGIPFVPVLKKGELPGNCSTVEYDLEHGKGFMEMQKGAVWTGQKVIILGDVIATGASAKAAGELVKLNGGKVVEYVFFVELSALGGAKKLDAPVYSVIKDES